MKRKNYQQRVYSKGLVDMKGLAVIFTIIFAVALTFGAINFVNQMSSEWKANEALERSYQAQQNAIELEAQRKQVEIDIQTSRDNAEMLQYFLNGFYVVLFTGSMLSIGIFIFNRYQMVQRARYLPQNGIYPLIEKQGVNGVTIIDPNKMIGSALFLASNGQIFEKYDSLEAQLAQNQLAQQSRNLNALSQGDKDLRATVVNRVLNGAPKNLLFKPDVETPVETPKLEVIALTYDQAFAKTSNHNWVIGQNDEGDLASINIADTPHIALFGATNTGKSSNAAMTIMLAALKSNFHVIALDGKNQGEWKKYSSHIEAYDIDYTTLPDVVSQLEDELSTRREVLKVMKCDSIYELSDKDYPFAPTLIIFEESGFVCNALQMANKNDTTVARIANLIRVSRSVGLHFLFIDQSPSKFPGLVLANCSTILSYKVNGKAGNAIDGYFLSQLAPKGEFWCNMTNSNYKSFHVKPELPKYLKYLPVVTNPLLQVVTVTTKERSYTSHPKSLLQPVTVTDSTVTETPNTDVTALVTTVTETPNSLLQPVTNAVTAVTESPNAQVARAVTRLSGKAKTQPEKLFVYQTFLACGTASKTATTIWNQTGSYVSHVKDIVREYEGSKLH